MRKFLNEFRTFAIKGNMLDMTVGVIVGGAFTALVTSIVANLATPLIGILIGVDFREWVIVLPRFYGNAEPSVLSIGLFINSAVSFVIIAFVLFIFVRMLNRFRNKQEEPPPPPKQEVLLMEIRDLLQLIAKEKDEK